MLLTFYLKTKADILPRYHFICRFTRPLCLTLAAALEAGVIDEDTTFDCSGSIHVLDATIHCSNRGGHGHQTLEQTAGNSCNPAFITYGLRLGTEKFYRLYEGLSASVNGSGIDLEGEALGILAPQETASEAGPGLLRLRAELQHDPRGP